MNLQHSSANVLQTYMLAEADLQSCGDMDLQKMPSKLESSLKFFVRLLVDFLEKVQNLRSKWIFVKEEMHNDLGHLIYVDALCSKNIIIADWLYPERTDSNGVTSRLPSSTNRKKSESLTKMLSFRIECDDKDKC